MDYFGSLGVKPLAPNRRLDTLTYPSLSRLRSWLLLFLFEDNDRWEILSHRKPSAVPSGIWQIPSSEATCCQDSALAYYIRTLWGPLAPSTIIPLMPSGKQTSPRTLTIVQGPYRHCLPPALLLRFQTQNHACILLSSGQSHSCVASSDVV